MLRIGNRLTTAVYGDRACGSFVTMLDDGTEVLTKGRFRFGPRGEARSLALWEEPGTWTTANRLGSSPPGGGATA